MGDNIKEEKTNDKPSQEDGSLPSASIESRGGWCSSITVEPLMILYMMAFMVTSVIEQTFYAFRACNVDHGYPPEICYNISQYTDINTEVQVTVAKFQQWFGVWSHLVPLVLALFLGAYSDRRGRKSIILAGLLGKLYFSLVLTLNTTQNWPVDWVLYTALIPSSLTGADLAIFAGAFAYLADVTTRDARTFRVAIFDALYLSTIPVGTALGNFLYEKVLNRSFTAMFAINSSLMMLASLDCWLRLRPRSRPEQSAPPAGLVHKIRDFFNTENLRRTITTLTKRRETRASLVLWLTLLSMALYTFQRDERKVMQLYTSVTFHWSSSQYSWFRTFQSCAFAVAVWAGGPLLSRALRVRDLPAAVLAAASHAIGHLILANAVTSRTLYWGAGVAALGPILPPMLRAFASKLLPSAERGVLFSALSVMENAVEMFAALAYSKIYKDSLENQTNLNAFIYLTVGTQITVLVFIVTMDALLKFRAPSPAQENSPLYSGATGESHNSLPSQ